MSSDVRWMAVVRELERREEAATVGARCAEEEEYYWRASGFKERARQLQEVIRGLVCEFGLE